MRLAKLSRRLARDERLCEQFESWTEVQARLPVMDRTVVQRQARALIDSRRPPEGMRTTGGSTAEPIRVPVWTSETQVAAEDLWYGRSWFGVDPADRLFLFWGHAHGLGRGVRRAWARTKRFAADRLLAYRRHSAYDLSEAGLRRAARALVEFQPDYVLGYSVALDRFARVNRSLTEELRRLRLKAVVATAEAFPRADSVEVLEATFGCPVRMEYGSVETGPIAHERLEGGYRTFWRHFFVEAHVADRFPGSREILVTALYPRCLPLIRYRIGDLLSKSRPTESGVLTFDRVVGRCNDYVVLGGGDVVHSEAFTHAVKDGHPLSRFEVVQGADGQITLRYEAARPLDEPDVRRIRERLVWVNSELGRIRFERVESLPVTVAGKSRPIRREDARGEVAEAMRNRDG